MSGNTSENKLRNNLRNLVISLVLNSISFSLLGLLFTIALSAIFAPDDISGDAFEPYKILGSLLPMVLFAIFSYSAAWRFGTRDYNLVKYGHLKKRPYVALLCGALSMIPAAAICIAAFVFFLTGAEFNFKMVFELLYFHYYWLLSLLGNNFSLYFLIVLTLPPVVLWGYYNGYRFISLREKILYKNPRDNPESKLKKDKRLR